MTCEEFLELAAAYGLGILDDGERAACVAHLKEAEHRGCLEAIADARDISSKLVVTLPVPHPSPDIWRAIESRLGGDVSPGGGGASSSSEGGPAVAGAVMVTPAAAPLAPPAKAMTSPRVWRELAGWFVAAAVVGFHLYNVPVDTQRQAEAGTGSRARPGDSGRDAMALMLAPGTRLATFAAQHEGIGGASVMLNVGEKKAVVVARAGKVSGPEGLRLWTVRGQLPPTSLGALTTSAAGGAADADLASVSVGAALFEPSLADKLLISVDTPEASAPQAVLLSATLH